MKIIVTLLLLTAVAAAQSTKPNIAQQATTAAHKNSSYIGPNGTAYVTRVVPVPQDVSPQAQAFLGRRMSDVQRHQTLAQQRHNTELWQTRAGNAWLKIYPAKISKSTIAGVPVGIVTPIHTPASHRNYVILNLHGGGFVVNAGTRTATIPLANLTKTKVISPMYPLSPEHAFPAALNAVVAVYKELLKTYPASHIIIYGTSAGAILTGEVAVDLKHLHLPEPAALGIFSGTGDLSRPGDTQAIFGLNGLSGYLAAPKPGGPLLSDYIGKTNPRNPILSPVFANLSGLPPTLFVSSTRDMLLSGTTILDRKFLNAGVKTQLIVFEGLPHTFWNNPRLPEAKEADHDMAHFFLEHLYGTAK